MSEHDNTKPLRVGDRVRLVSQQYTNAYALGTATIVEVIKQHRVDDTWEYRVQTDQRETRSWNIVDTPDPLLASLLPVSAARGTLRVPAGPSTTSESPEMRNGERTREGVIA